MRFAGAPRPFAPSTTFPPHWGRAAAASEHSINPPDTGAPIRGSPALAWGAALAEKFDACGGGVVLVSDRVRKQLPDLVESAGAGGVDEGLYRPEARGRVYAALLERARTVVAAGRTAILDAT